MGSRSRCSSRSRSSLARMRRLVTPGTACCTGGQNGADEVTEVAGQLVKMMRLKGWGWRCLEVPF